MGVGGINTFDNDDALDFVVDVITGDGATLITDAVGQVAGGYGGDLAVSSRALAAAEFVAALMGHPALNFPPEVRDWVASHPTVIDPQPAREAVMAVLAESELADLWTESGHYHEWREAVTGLLRRLGGDMPDTKTRPAKVRAPKVRQNHPGVPPINEHARALILKYSSSYHWVNDILREEVDYLKQVGLWSDTIIKTHDDTIAWACEEVNRADRTALANAFLASLSSQRLELRSALGCYAAGYHLRPHQFSPFDLHAQKMHLERCIVCNKQLSTVVDCPRYIYYQHKYGGLYLDDPAVIGFTLTEFARLPFCTPTEEDINIFQEIIAAASSLPPKAGPNVLLKAIKNILPTNINQSESLLAIIGYCGILQPAKYPSFRVTFVDHKYQNEVTTDDWEYPISKWRGVDGVNQDALSFYFAHITPISIAPSRPPTR